MKSFVLRITTPYFFTRPFFIPPWYRQKKQAGFRQGAFDVKCALSFRFLFSYYRLKTPPSPWSDKGNRNAHISFVLLNTYTTIEYLPTHDFLQLIFGFYHS